MTSTSQGNAFTILNPDIAAQQQAVARQQALAQMIMQSGNTPIDPARSSGKYIIPISPLEGFAKVGQSLAGAYLQKKADEKNLALSEQLQKRMMDAFGGGSSSQPSVPWTNPDTGQTVQTGPAGAAGSGTTGYPSGGSLAVNGMSPRTAMLASTLYPEAYGGALMDQYKMTDQTKNEMQHNMPKALADALYQNKQQKDASIEMQPGNTLLMPNGQGSFNPMVAAQFDKGIQGAYDAGGHPSVSAITGAAQAAAGQAGAIQRAQQANTIFPNQTVNGRDNVPLTGAQIMEQNLSAPPQTGARPPQWNGPNDPGQEPVQTNVMPNQAPIQPGAMSRPVFGATPAEKSQGTKQGENAAAANEGYQKQKAAMDGIEAALNRLEQINKQVPYGNLGAADLQAGISNTISPTLGLHPDTAKAAQEWEQLTGQNILGGIKQLQGLGRLDLPEIQQVMKTYGLGMENSPEVRAQGLANLRTMLRNNLVTSQNSVSGLNTSQVPQVSPAQAQPYTNATSPQTGQRIKVIAPNGQMGTVDAAHLQDLLSQGGKVAQ